MVTSPSRRDFLGGMAGLGGIAVAGCLGDESEQPSDRVLAVDRAILYQGPDCPCCEDYAAYLDAYLTAHLEVIVTEDLAPIKYAWGIDRDLWSCHTAVLDEYAIEGHVPVEIVETLLDDRPDLAAIALPGMPSGSPGMGGPQLEKWTIYSVDRDGRRDVFTRV